MVNVFEHDVIPTWSGGVYQGRIAVYLAIKEIIELRNDNKMSEIDRYAIEMEKCEDIAIVHKDENEEKQDILYSMSSGQLSAVAISFLLCMNQVYGKHNPCSVLLIDDPVQTIDDVNIVGLVDLLRYEFEDRQIFISTHEQTFEWFLRYRYSKADKAVKIFNMKEIMLM